MLDDDLNRNTKQQNILRSYCLKFRHLPLSYEYFKMRGWQFYDMQLQQFMISNKREINISEVSCMILKVQNITNKQ